MSNHHTLVTIRKVGDPRIVEIHDKVEMIKFVDGEWHVVLKDGVVHHYPSESYVFGNVLLDPSMKNTVNILLL